VAEKNLVAVKLSQVRKEGGLIQEYFFQLEGNVAEPQWDDRNAIGALRQAIGVKAII